MLADVLDRIAAAPRGPHTAAVFDVDGTVISGYSATAWYRHRLLHGELGPRELARTAVAAVRGVDDAPAFTALVERSAAAWRGRRAADLDELGDRILRHDVGGQLHPEAWELIAAHRRRGHQLVLASSSTRFQVEPLARELGADHVLCTALETDSDGILTGRVEGEPLWGPAKAQAVRRLARRTRFALSRSFAYSNGVEDVPLLDLVGTPVAVAPDRGLDVEARERGWIILDCPRRGGQPGVRDVARTAAFYGGLAGGLVTGAGLAVLRRSRQQVFDVGSIGADVSLALAGVDLNVAGREHLWSQRPCIFIFNHQSNIDPVIVMKLIRDRYTAVGKAEARNIPGFGQLFALAGVTFVDRADTAKAKDALEPVIAKIRDEGLSLLIAPEGTRSVTPRLGPFKKGAFHLAMRAGVPVVPIVFRNTGEVFWRGSRVVRPGTVDVLVLPPVATDTWTAEDLSARVEDVRASMAAVLEGVAAMTTFAEELLVLDSAGGVFFVQAWCDRVTERAVLLALGDVADAGCYRQVAEALVADGAAVFAADQGTGGTRDGFDIESTAAGLEAVAELAASRHPRKPLVLIGHGLGGAAARRFLERGGDVDAIVLSGAAGEPTTDLPTLRLPGEDGLLTEINRDEALDEVCAFVRREGS